MEFAALWTLLLETIKVSQLMDGAGQTTTTPAWTAKPGTCNPEGKSISGQTIGFCAATRQLETKCSRLDIGRSNDCVAYEGNWCCYLATPDAIATTPAPANPTTPPLISSILEALKSLSEPSLRSKVTLASSPDTTTTTTSTTSTTTTIPTTASTTTSTTTTTTATTSTTTQVTTTASTTTLPTTTSSVTTTAHPSPLTTNTTLVNATTVGSNSTTAPGNSSSNSSSNLLTDGSETLWRWSNGKSSMVAVLKNVVNDQTPAAIDTSSAVQDVLLPEFDNSFKKSRNRGQPTLSRCYMWPYGWNDCWAQPQTF